MMTLPQQHPCPMCGGNEDHCNWNDRTEVCQEMLFQGAAPLKDLTVPQLYHLWHEATRLMRQDCRDMLAQEILIRAQHNYIIQRKPRNAHPMDCSCPDCWNPQPYVGPPT